MKFPKITDQKGFSVIELLLVVVIIGVLATLVLSTRAGILRNNRNQERQRDIQDIYQQLEAYNVENSYYPTLADMNNPEWVTANMKTLNLNSLRDPSSHEYQLVAKPQSKKYAYDVRAADGSTCNNVKKPCIHYTLTATLEDSPQKVYTKSSLN